MSDILFSGMKKIFANQEAQSIYNLAYLDTPQTRLQFEKELIIMWKENNIFLMAAMRNQYHQVMKIATSKKPMDWAVGLLRKHKIVSEFE